MDIVVCVKQVAQTSEAEIRIDESGKDIRKEDLVFDLNEADNYALEEALLIKEKFGGIVTVITLGDKDSDRMLRTCLSKGADNAIRLWDSGFQGSDGYATAKILASAIKKLKFDIILTGIQASDDGYAQVGVALAQILGIPHASMVTKLEIEDGKARVERELESGLGEVVEVKLPALFTIQTGINEPRYGSVRGIKMALKKPIRVMDSSALGLAKDEVGESGSKTKVEKLFIPVIEKRAEIIQGDPNEVSEKLSKVLKERGLI